MEGNHEQDILQHHGIKGMKWGVRRFQNKDGSHTPAGAKRAARLAAKKTREDLKDRVTARRLTIQKAKQQMREEAADRKTARKIESSNAKAARAKAKRQADDDLYELPDEAAEARAQKQAERGKRMAIAATAIVGAVVLAVAYKKLKDNGVIKSRVDEAAKKAKMDSDKKQWKDVVDGAIKRRDRKNAKLDKQMNKEYARWAKERKANLAKKWYENAKKAGKSTKSATSTVLESVGTSLVPATPPTAGFNATNSVLGALGEILARRN